MYPDNRQDDKAFVNKPYPGYQQADTNSFDTANADLQLEIDVARMKRKKRIKFTVLSVVAVLIIISGGVLFRRLFGNLSLVTFEEANYSVYVPKDYQYVYENGFSKFVERKGDPSTRSFVIIQTRPYAENTSYDDAIDLLNLYENQIPSLVGQPSDSSQQVENVSSQRIIHREHEALRITADLVKNDKRAKVDMLVVAGDRAIYVIGVAAHSEDVYLVQSTTKIITSLTLYE